MENPSSLANPKKLSLDDFPTEQKRKKESRWKKYRRQHKLEAKFRREERYKRRVEQIGRAHV